MRLLTTKTAAVALSLLAASSMTSSALVVMLSDTVAPGPAGALETLLGSAFSNVTEIRHGNYANFSGATSQDALLGTGAFAGNGPADIVIIGRTLTSTEYQNVATGYNNLTIPVVSLTSYTARQDGNRLGWHASGATQNIVSTLGTESTVTAAGSAAFGFAAGSYDFVNSPGDNFNGLAGGTTAYGGGTILATMGTDVLAAYWATGTAPGNTTIAGQPATFPGPRLLFNLDNDAPGGDLGNLTADGRTALISVLDYYTPLAKVPEPTTALLGLAGVAAVGFRRRRAV